MRPDVAILIPTLEGGGAERVAFELARGMISRGLSVDLVVLNRRGELAEHVPAGVQLVDLESPKLRNAPGVLADYFRRRHPRGIISNLWELNIAAIFARMLAGVTSSKLVVVEHNSLSRSESHRRVWHSNFIGLLLRCLYPWASQIVSVSKGAAEDLACFTGLRNSSIKVIYNPIQPVSTVELPVPSEWSKLAWLQPGVKRIVAVGKLKRQKDYPTLLKSFRDAVSVQSNLRLLIIGDGPERNFVESEVARLGLKDLVEMPGFMFDPGPFYQRADLFVLSSRWEGFGNVIVEALSAGLPVIASDCRSGPSESLDSGRFGRLFPVQDHQTLARLIVEELPRTPDRAALMARAEEYSLDRAVDEYLRILFP